MNQPAGKNVIGIYKVALTLLGEDDENLWYKTARMMADALEQGRIPNPTPVARAGAALNPLSGRQIPTSLRQPNNDKPPMVTDHNPYERQGPGGHANPDFYAYQHLRDCTGCKLKYHGRKNTVHVVDQIKEDRRMGRI